MRLRFSLRTLLLGVLLAGSGFGLWWRWAPWAVERRLASDEKECVAGVYSHDGERLVAAFRDGSVQEWTISTGARRTLLNGKDGAFHGTVKFSPDLRTLVVFQERRWQRSPCTPSFDVHVWDLEQGLEQARLVGHESFVSSTDFSPDQSRIVTASTDGTARIWNGATGAELFKLDQNNKELSSAMFSPDGQHILTRGKALRQWNANTGAELFSIVPTTEYWRAYYLNQGRTIEVLSDTYCDSDPRNELSDYDAYTGKLIARRATAPRDSYNDVSHENTAFICACSGPGPVGSLAVIDTNTGACVFIIDRVGSEWTPYAQSPDGAHYAIFDTFDRRISIWQRRRPEHPLGAAELPEFWMTVVCGGMLGLTVVREWSKRRARAPVLLTSSETLRSVPARE